MKHLVVAVCVFVVAACSGASPVSTQPRPSATPTPPVATPPSTTTSPTASGSFVPPTTTVPISNLKMPTGQDLCYLLTAADFTAAGVAGAGQLSTNEYDTSYFCVWAGKSVATGGIEMDAFIVDDPQDRDESFDSVDTGDTAEDVTAQVPGADRAHIGTTSSDGPVFAEVAVQAGNFIFGIGIPPAGDWHTQLITLANLTLTRAAALATGSTALPAASPTQ